MFTTQQLAECSNLCADVCTMKLPKLNATLDQLLAVKKRLEHTINQSIWQSLEFNQPIEREYAVILNKPECDQIMVLLVLWPGDIRGQIHNHLTWAVVGVVRGIEESQLWTTSVEEGSSRQTLVHHSNQVLNPGETCIMRDDFTIHNVNNLAPEGDFSCSLHIYGQDLRVVDRQIYDSSKKTFVNNPNTEFITLNEFQSHCS